MSTLIDAPKRVLAVALAYLLVVAPVAPRAAHADEPEALTFSEYTESLASAPRADNAQTALKAREIPVDNRGAFTTSVGIDVPPGRRGMTPALAVAYSSARVRQEGPFGVGFALEVGAIRRSTAGGYPQLERVGAAAVYDDDAEGAFDGPAGRLRELECGALPGECPPESTGRVFAPEIETAPVRYEYRPDASGGAWIEYRPDGVRRYFGVRPTDGVVMRIQNAHGTFAWLLLREVDRFGNSIRYDYTGAAWSGGAVPQEAPVLRSVRWGGNDRTGAAEIFSVVVDTVATEPGGVDFMNGGVRHRYRATVVRVGEGANATPEHWRYTPTFASSPYTAQRLLAALVRTAPGEASANERRWTFTYSGTRDDAGAPVDARWSTTGTPLAGDLYAEPACGAGPCIRPSQQAATLGSAMNPRHMRSAQHFMDADGDGLLDLVYHPAHLKAPAARLRAAESHHGALPGPFDDGPYGGPPGLSSDYQHYQELTDLDGDGDVDGLSWPLLAGSSTGLDPAVLDLGDICGDELMWNRCGNIDPLPPQGPWASEPDALLRLGDVEIGGGDGGGGGFPAPRVNCLEIVTACINGQGPQGTINVGTPSELSGTPAPFQLYVDRAQSRASAQAFTTAPLNGWPDEVYPTVQHWTYRSDQGATYVGVRPARDFQAPFVDLNADGLLDVVLLKYLYLLPVGDRPLVKLFPNVWIADEEGFRNESEGVVSDFASSAVAALRPGERLYPEHMNPTAMIVDLNADGLPDLARATPPALGGCRNGHDVWLNRGSSFAAGNVGFAETWTASSTSVTGLGFLVNRALQCRSRAGISDPGVGDRLPASALAMTDVNADGRVDLVFVGNDDSRPDASDPSGRWKRYFRNGRRGFAARSFPPSFPSDVKLVRGEYLRDLAPSNRGYTASDLARMIDVDQDGLVDVLRSGLYDFGADAQIEPARWYRNIGEHPDYLVNIATTGGASTAVAYVTATAHAARQGANRTIVTLGESPPGLRVVSTVTSKAGPSDPAETIRFRYASFVRDAATREPIGFSTVTSIHAPGTVGGVTGPSLTVTRTFDTTAEVAGVAVRYPFRGQLARVVADDGSTATDEVIERAAIAVGPVARVRTTTTERSTCLTGVVSCATLVELQTPSEYGYPRSIEVTDLENPIDVLTTELKHQHQTATWNLGLVTSAATFGLTETLYGTRKQGVLLAKAETSYQASGLPVTETRHTVDGASACASQPDDVTTYRYTTEGLVAQSERAARTVSVTYDTKRLYPATTTITAAGAPSMSELVDHDLRTGAVVWRQDVNGQRWSAKHDSFGRVLEETGPEEIVLRKVAYVDNAGAGRPSLTEALFVADGVGTERKTTFDGHGQTLAVVAGDGTSGFIRRTRATLDGFGRAVHAYQPRYVPTLDTTVASDDGAGNRTETTYDGFDRPEHVVTPDGRVAAWIFGPREVTAVNPRGFATVHDLDARGDVVVTTSLDDDGSTVLALTELARDGLGRVVRVTDADGNDRHLAYDLGGRLATTTLPAAPPSLIGLATMCYDNDDGLVHRETAAGREVDIERDGLGRPRQVDAWAPDAPSTAVTYRYDDAASNGRGRLSSRTDTTGTRTYSYDDYGRIGSAHYGASTTVAAGFEAAVKYDHDLQGQLLRVDVGGDLPPVRFDFHRDNLGRVREVTDQSARSVVEDVDYDAYDRAVSSMFSTSAIWWDYDPQSEALVQIDSIPFLNDVPLAAQLNRVEYAYDDNLNVVSEQRSFSDANGRVHEYDGLDRLTRSAIQRGTNPSYVERYKYTPAGTIVSAAGQEYRPGQGTTSPGAVVTVKGGAILRDLAYDLDGFARSDGGTTLGYDGLGCLVRASQGTSVVERTCDDDGHELFRKTVQSTKTQRVVDIFGLAEFRPDAGTLTLRVKVNGTAVAEEVYKAPSATVTRVDKECSVVHTDLRGSVLLQSTTTNPPAIARDADYDPWGATLVGSKLPVHRFVDTEPDVFGYYVFGKRVYSPTLRRWLSPDPLVLANPEVDAATARQMDLWGYAANNPVKLTDRNGLVADTPGEMAGFAAMHAGMSPEEQAQFVESTQAAAFVGAGASVFVVGGLSVAATALAPFVPVFGPKATEILSSLDPGNVANVGVSAGNKVATAAVDQATPVVEKAAETVAPRLTKEAERGIRSLEKRITEHEKKLEEFLKSPTIRPGMEKLSKEQITKAQQARAEHLRKEIDTFKENIEKLKGGTTP